jgi:hypothetical protein
MFCAAMMLMATSCKKPVKETIAPDPQLSLSFKKNASGAPFVLNQVITGPAGKNYLLYTLLFYTGNPRLVKTDGSEVGLSDILLINMDDNINKNDATHDPALVGTTFNFTIPAGTYKAIRFGLGVPKSLEYSQTNKLASEYPSGHPLGFNRGTFWDWLNLYRYTMIEGRVDTSKTPSTPTSIFTYHTGYDSLYREVEFSDNFSIDKGGSHSININLDVNKLLFNTATPVDLTGESSTNMDAGNARQGRIGVKIMNNFVLALSKE